MPLKKYIVLILRASLLDGFWIVIFFVLSVRVFGDVNILLNWYQLAFFFALTLVFGFFDEKISLKLKRWEYASRMPTILGVGITPFLELGITGLLTFLVVF